MKPVVPWLLAVCVWMAPFGIAHSATPRIVAPSLNHICSMWAQTDDVQKDVMLNETKVEAFCLARSLAKVCKAIDGDGFADYRVLDETQACIDRENGLAHAAWHGHKKGKKS
jgi:hypothetical protein